MHVGDLCYQNPSYFDMILNEVVPLLYSSEQYESPSFHQNPQILNQFHSLFVHSSMNSMTREEQIRSILQLQTHFSAKNKHICELFLSFTKRSYSFVLLIPYIVNVIAYHNRQKKHIVNIKYNIEKSFKKE